MKILILLLIISWFYSCKKDDAKIQSCKTCVLVERYVCNTENTTHTLDSVVYCNGEADTIQQGMFDYQMVSCPGYTGSKYKTRTCQ